MVSIIDSTNPIYVKKEEEAENYKTLLHEQLSPLGSSRIKMESNNEDSKKELNQLAVTIADSSSEDQVKKVNDIGHSPRYFCRICIKTFKTVDNYRRHMSQLHKVTRSLYPYPNRKPDSDDPSFYFAACDMKHELRRDYWGHLRRHHRMMTFVPIKVAHKIDGLPDPDDPSLHCFICNWTYKSKRGYREHLSRYHDMDLKPLRPEIRTNFLPNPDDPDFYCQSCQLICRDKAAFLDHMQMIHELEPKPSNKQPVFDPNMVVDINDPKNTSCIICKKKYCDRGHYKKHVKLVHNGVINGITIHFSNKTS